MSQNTWILVAHRAGARLFSCAGPHHGLKLEETVAHPEGRLRNQDVNSDTGGRSFDRFGGQRHTMETEHSPTEHIADIFVKSLADKLRDGRLANRYAKLVLVAGPRLLGKLREGLDDGTRALVTDSLDRDLGEMPDHELEKYLLGALGL